MRILLVDLATTWRGGQSQGLLLLRGLAARGHAVHLLAAEDGAFAERARAENLAVTIVPHALRRARAAQAIRRLLREQRFDVVHANEAHALTSAWLAGAHRRAVLVAARRVAYPLGTGALARARYRAPRRIIAISRFVAQSVIDSGVPAGIVSVVYDGAEIPPPSSPASLAEVRRATREPCGVRDGQPLIGCVGYLLPEKGQEFLLRALPKILARFPDCRVLLAGDGPSRARLEQIAGELKIGAAVHFAGHVQDISTVYEALDVFVFPSLAEPLGSSLLSAMAAGIPVVAVASGGVPEVVEGGAGLLVPGPDPKRIAESVLRLLVDPQWAARLGEAGRKVIQDKFSADQMVENTLRVYEQACEESQT
jgi:glycosyltransferase involved in cell wall biosynthesis